MLEEKTVPMGRMGRSSKNILKNINSWLSEISPNQ